MSLVRKFRFLILILGCLLPSLIQAQPSELSAAVMVIGDTVTLQRAGTAQTFSLSEGAVMPVGAGDTLLTGSSGRALIAFGEVNQLLLLPNTEYELIGFTQLENGQFRIEAELHEGVIVQQFQEDPSDWQYQLATDSLTVEQPSEQFAVWAIADYLEAAISAEGTLTVQIADSDEPVEIQGPAGVFPPYSVSAVALEEPYHAAQLLARSIGCSGTITTNGSEGLRLRRGAALDYQVVEVLQDGQHVPVIGTTENGLWYGIPYQTGLGWLYSGLVAAECENLPQFPNLVGSQNEFIRAATEAEIELLRPFYGLPETNRVFYR